MTYTAKTVSYFFLRLENLSSETEFALGFANIQDPTGKGPEQTL